jgi:hypothetical protein
MSAGSRGKPMNESNAAKIIERLDKIVLLLEKMKNTKDWDRLGEKTTKPTPRRCSSCDEEIVWTQKGRPKNVARRQDGTYVVGGPHWCEAWHAKHGANRPDGEA